MEVARKPLCLAFLGCGHIGQAILGSLLPLVSRPASLVSNINVAVNDEKSYNQLRKDSWLSAPPVTLFLNQNIQAVKNADAVLFAFPPDKVHDVIGATGMKEALQHKGIISLLARTPRDELRHILATGEGKTKEDVVRAMPTIGAATFESATLLTDAPGRATDATVELAAWIFGSLGKVFRVSDVHFDSLTGISSASNALAVVAVQQIARIAASKGVPRDKVIPIVSQCIRGTVGMLLSEIEPENLQRSLSTPGSITEQAISGFVHGQLSGILGEAVNGAIKRASDYEK